MATIFKMRLGRQGESGIEGSESWERETLRLGEAESERDIINNNK